MKARTSIAVSIVVAVLCSSIGISVTAVEAATIRVPDEQPSIQAGLDVAAVGDTVLVASNTYMEHDIGMADGVTLLGETGNPADVIIDAQGLGRVIDCTDLTHPIAIIGLTVANGLDSGDGGGIHCDYVSVLVEDVVFLSNTTSAHSGGGMSSQNGSAILSGVAFRDNYAFLEGGGLYCGSGSTVDLTDVAFDGNEAGQGGGLGCEWANVTVANTYINGNLSFYASHGQGCGGGIWCKDSFLTLTDVIVSNNVSSEGYGGGLACDQGQVLELSHVVFVGNEATWGGAVHCGWPSGSTTTLNLTNTTLYGNIAENGSGISCRVYSDVSCEATIIAGGIGGTAVWCEVENPPDFTCSDIFGNEEGDWIGCISDQFGTNGNISEDPLFCGPAESDFSLRSDSPCAGRGNEVCGLIGALPVGCFADDPMITSIYDVGNDEGRQVRLEWLRSAFDVAGSGTVITDYGIYRRRDEFLREGEPAHTQVGDSVPGGGADATARLAGWDYIETVPARGDSVYQYVAPTLCDSTELDGVCWSTFFVSATTPDPIVYYDSPPDSGYSVDNLAPEPPAALRGVFDPATGHIALEWDRCQSPDLQYFELHRGQGDDFPPILGNRIYAGVDTTFLDMTVQWDESTNYKVAAVDFGGNRSAYSVCSALATGVPDGEIPSPFSLHPPTPNPFGPSTTIAYDVPSAARVSVRVYNASGRLVRTLLDRAVDPGRHAAIWDGRDSTGRSVATGVYFCRVETEGKALVQRMVLLR